MIIIHIENLRHYCNDKDGRYHIHSVIWDDIENKKKCPHCGKRYAKTKTVLAHIYNELTKYEDKDY